MTPLDAILYVWIVWFATWMMAALWVNRTVKMPSEREQLPLRILIGAGAGVLFWGYRSAPGIAPDAGWLLFAIVVLGILFAWWARLHLGRLWSGRIAKKEDHRVIDTGPYAIVRHPIYTGILAAALATGIAEGRPLAILGAIIASAGFTMRAQEEERFLTVELPSGAYESYARRVPMLIPFLLRKG